MTTETKDDSIAEQLASMEKRLRRRARYEAELDEIIAEREKLKYMEAHDEKIQMYQDMIYYPERFPDYELVDFLAARRLLDKFQKQKTELKKRHQRTSAKLFLDQETRKEEAQKRQRLWKEAESNPRRRAEVEKMTQDFRARYRLVSNWQTVSQRNYIRDVSHLFEETSDEKINRLETEMRDLKGRCEAIRISSSVMPRVETPEPRVETPEPRVETPEPRVETPEPRVETPEPHEQISRLEKDVEMLSEKVATLEQELARKEDYIRALQDQMDVQRSTTESTFVI
jgi:hypothetical protein